MFSGASPRCGTGTNGTTPSTSVVSQATTVNGTGEAQGSAETPNARGNGPEAPSAAPEFPPTTTSTSRETVLPGESYE